MRKKILSRGLGHRDTTLLVFAPEGLKPAVTALGAAFSATDAEVRDVVIGSDTGAANAMALPNLDVVIYPSWTDIEALATAGLLADRGRTVTHLVTRVQVSGVKAATLRNPSDLANDGIRIGLPPHRQDGGAAMRMLARAKLPNTVAKRTLPRGAQSALRDGTIDAWLGLYPLSVGVPMRLPAHLREHQPVAAAVLKQSQHSEAASRFLTWLEGPTAQKLWTEFGTVPVVPNGLPIAPTALPIRVKTPTHKSAAVTIDNRILLLGGRSSGRPIDRLAWIDPANGRSFELATKLPEGRSVPQPYITAKIVVSSYSRPRPGRA